MKPPHHPVILLWAHPRSLSTALERIMRERGDCHCLHEPFIHYYYSHLGRRNLPHFDAESNQPRSFDDIIGLIYRESRNQPVFVKDMAYYVVPEFMTHPDLARHFRHAFLIRDPYRALMSYYKLDTEFVCEEAGLEAQWRLFRWITELAGEEPPVVRAEDIQRNPRGTIGALWQRLGLEYVDKAFSWKARKVPRDWEPVAAWHERTARHSEIVPDPREDVEVHAEFSQLVRQAPKLQEFLERHWPYYLELSSRSRSVGADQSCAISLQTGA